MIELTAECLFSYSGSKVLLIAREDCAEQWPPTPHTRPTDHWLLLIVFLFSWHSTVCIEGRGSAGYTPLKLTKIPKFQRVDFTHLIPNPPQYCWSLQKCKFGDNDCLFSDDLPWWLLHIVVTMRKLSRISEGLKNVSIFCYQCVGLVKILIQILNLNI